VGGNQDKVQIYDDASGRKEYLMTLRGGGSGLPGHSKRIFAVKFDPTQENIIYSAGWDEAVYVSDLRLGGMAVSVFPGPHVCGESIDV
jgi:WD40 repeat protein